MSLHRCRWRTYKVASYRSVEPTKSHSETIPVHVVIDVNVSLNVNVDDLTMDTQTLSYKKLDVYQSSIQFLSIALRLIAVLPKGQAKLADAGGSGTPLRNRTWFGDGMRRHPRCS